MLCEVHLNNGIKAALYLRVPVCVEGNYQLIVYDGCTSVRMRYVSWISYQTEMCMKWERAHRVMIAASLTSYWTDLPIDRLTRSRSKMLRSASSLHNHRNVVGMSSHQAFRKAASSRSFLFQKRRDSWRAQHDSQNHDTVPAEYQGLAIDLNVFSLISPLC